MNNLMNKTIGEIVAVDYRTAAVFTRNNMDFCCGGHKTVDEVCTQKKVDKEKLLQDIATILETKTENQIDFLSWPADLLTDYIVKTHHRYVSEKAPVIFQYLNKLCKVHGERHPELFEIQQLFAACAEALLEHMHKEEHVLFPYIQKMVTARLSGTVPEVPHFGTVNNPIEMMLHEHETEGIRLRQIAALSNNYTAPADGCSTYRVAFAMLQEFEQDLHKHIHLENNILFPKAVTLEKSLNGDLVIQGLQ